MKWSSQPLSLSLALLSLLCPLLSPPIFAKSSILSPGRISPTTYEACQTGYNDYLQNDLTAALSENPPGSCSDCKQSNSLESSNIRDLSLVVEDSKLPPRCILSALHGIPKPGGGLFYGQCDSSSGKVQTIQGDHLLPRPCLSREYHTVIYRSFIQSMNCLGIEPKELFPLLSFESAFQLNVGNSGGDWGISQLSPAGIDSNHWEPILGHYRSLSECARIQTALSRPVVNKFAPCERIGLPQNPTRSLIYGGYLYLQNKKLGQKLVSELIELKKKTPGSLPLSPEEADTLAIALTRMMYNGGAGGVAQSFRTFIHENGILNLSLKVLRTTFSDWSSLHFGEGIAYFKTHEKMLESIRSSAPHYAERVESFAEKFGPECAL